MKFIDEIKIFVKAGNGGNGIVSFYKTKFSSKGRPDGGNGGNGGDIIVTASNIKNNFADFCLQKCYFAENGKNGGKNRKTGKYGQHTKIIVPIGTIIKDQINNKIICDLSENGQSYLLVKGGRGGKGNKHFVSSTFRSPRFAQSGTEGEKKWILLEIKLIADIGIIGFPNVGKSTLTHYLTNAKPKIANYPFTTLSPVLGVVKTNNERTFIIADIPGIIKNAHKGVGLGIKFLKHIEKTKIILHMIDCSYNKKLVWNNYEIINYELLQFNPELFKKKQIVVCNKIDVNSKNNFKKISNFFEKKNIRLFPISALTGKGIELLLNEIIHLLSINNCKNCVV